MTRNPVPSSCGLSDGRGERVKAEFSELSYATCFTGDLLERWSDHVVVAPEWPTQRAEGGPGGGYDLAVPSSRGFVYYAQFKRPEYMSYAKAGQADFGLPYYRFTVHGSRRSDQHTLLLDLQSDADVVEYVCARFHLQSDLNRCFISRTTIDESMRVQPAQVGVLPDSDDHFVVYSIDGQRATRYSDPVPIENPGSGQITPDGFQPIPTDRVDDANDQVGEALVGEETLGDRIQRIADRLVDSLPGAFTTAAAVRDADPLGAAQALARLLGAEVFVSVRNP